MRTTILTLLALAASGGIAYGQTFSGGDGSQSSPYLIKSKADMSELCTAVGAGNTFAGKYFRLENDIAYTSSDSFTPVGYTGTASPKKFGGDFDGNGKTLSGLNVNGTYYAGVFSYLDAGGCIHDLALDNIKVTSSNSNGGTLVAKSDGTVSRVRALNVDFTSTNGGYKGGLVGFVNKGTVSDCYVGGSIMSTGSVGGIAGQNYGSISRCHSNATIVVQSEGSSSAHIGGIASITLTLSGDTARISDSYFTGSIQGAPQNNCGGITSTLNVGYLDRCWNGGYIASSGNAGGLVGTFNAGHIRDCYNAGTVVDAGAASGGLVGMVSNTNHKEIVLARCINMGSIMFSSVTREKGCELIGKGYDEVNVISCFYDRQMSGYTDSPLGLSTAELTSGNVLPGFGPDWKFSAGMYPRLVSTASADGAMLNAAPVMLAAGEDHLHVKSAFTLSGASGVEWELRGGTDCRLSGNTVSVTRTADVQNLVLTSYLGDFEKRTLVSVYPQIFQGDGTETSPYLIADKNDMMRLKDAINRQGLDFSGEYLRLTSDIDMSGVADFEPFGFNTTTAFNGNLDGAGHSICNLAMNARENKVMNVGLFTVIAPQGIVRNLIMDKSCRFLAYRNFAPFAATLYGTIENCRNYADVPATDGYSAGIVAFVYGKVIRCFNAGKISASDRNGSLGGIFYSGYAGSVVKECQNAGLVTASCDKASNLGGIGGSMYGTLTDCLNTGNVTGGTGSATIGGIVAADNTAAVMTGCVSLAPITAGTYNYVGSVVGNPRGSYKNVYADAQITLYGNSQPGITMSGTSELIGATAPGGLGKEWVFAAGRYPMLACFSNLPEARIGSMPVVFPDGICRNEITASGQLCEEDGLAWSVDGAAFRIDGNRLVYTVPEDYSKATLKASCSGVSRTIPLGALPSLFAGEGTVKSPWLISSPADLDKLSKSMADGSIGYRGRCFALAADLDMSAFGTFAPIAASGKFEAVFDGRGHTIDNLRISSTTEPAALFMTVGESGTVRDLTIGRGSSISGKGSVGAFVSTLEGNLINCVNHAGISSTAAIAGGLVGTAKASAHMENLTNEADITTTQSKTAGIAGAVTSGTVTARNLVNRGDISSSGSYVAGIIAHATGVKINVAANYGEIKTTATDGAGILAYTSDITLLDSCANYGAVSAKTEGAGLVGNATKAITVSASLNAGSVTVTAQNAAGIIASCDQPVIKQCANFGTIVNSSTSLTATQVGASGIVGKGDPVVTDCCNFGAVTAKDNLGSVIAYYKQTFHTSAITNFYNLGAVTATGTSPKAANMFVGKQGKTTYTNCWYDNQVLGGVSEDRGTDTRSLLATDFGSGFTDSNHGYPLPTAIAGNEVARAHRTALVFHVATDHYGNVTDYFRVKADPELVMEPTEVFIVKPDNRVNLKPYTTGDFTLATRLGNVSRPIALHVATQETTGISTAETGAGVMAVEYYTADGIRIAAPARGAGIVIRRTVFTDGTVMTEKVIL